MSSIQKVYSEIANYKTKIREEKYQSFLKDNLFDLENLYQIVNTHKLVIPFDDFSRWCFKNSYYNVKDVVDRD